MLKSRHEFLVEILLADLYRKMYRLRIKNTQADIYRHVIYSNDIIPMTSMT